MANREGAASSGDSSSVAVELTSDAPSLIGSRLRQHRGVGQGVNVIQWKAVWFSCIQPCLAIFSPVPNSLSELWPLGGHYRRGTTASELRSGVSRVVFHFGLECTLVRTSCWLSTGRQAFRASGSVKRLVVTSGMRECRLRLTARPTLPPRVTRDMITHIKKRRWMVCNSVARHGR